MDDQDHDASMVWRGKPAWSSYIYLWIFATIFAIRGLISLRMGYWTGALFHLATIGMLAFLAIFLHQTTHYRVTREAIYRARGILGKDEQSFPISSIDSVSKQQGPLERLLGSGNVILHLKGGIRERLAGVKDPDVVCNKIRAML
ncbi:MAG: PH domain-containing protein [Nitrospira sp.]|nr:PH domain-containing protein [Nitrospira sp.]